MFYAAARESYFFLFLAVQLFPMRVLAGKNGVIAGHGAGDLERHCMDG